MAGFPTLAALHEALAKPGIRALASKGVPPTGVAFGVSSYWTASGTPAAGAAPGSTAAVAPTRSTPGALPFPLASPGKVRHLGRALFGGGGSGYTHAVFDRLLHSDGLSANSTGVQPIGGASAPTRGAFDAHELYFELYSPVGATPFNGALTYVNQDDQARTTPAFAVPASAGAGRMIHVPLAPGDWQVKSFVSHQGDAPSGLAGNGGYTLVRRLAMVGADRSISRPVPLDAIFLGAPKVPDDSCLFFALEFGASGSTLAALGALWFPEADAA
ncbi:MAG TPA: hypothetical protein VFS43_38365 [Polyangiaceae bacterium]|nr:hypothetical protein [Polyangiaceae bacterium]